MALHQNMYLIAHSTPERTFSTNNVTFIFMSSYTNLPFNQEQIFVLTLYFSYETINLINEWRDDPLLMPIPLAPHSVTDVDESPDLFPKALHPII